MSTEHGLGRYIQFDERSRGFPIRSVAPSSPMLRSYTWRMLPNYVIDQGQEGACVGYAITNELIARPAEVSFGDKRATERFAREKVYWVAQRNDPFAGGAYPGASPRMEGTSVLAGIQAAHSYGYFDEYRWAFGIDDLVVGLGYNGPAVLGVWWRDSMYETDENYEIHLTGDKVGGHAILARGVQLHWRSSGPEFGNLDWDQSKLLIRNSWGPGFGNHGDCLMSLRDAAEWLEDDGEVVFMVKRTSVV